MYTKFGGSVLSGHWCNWCKRAAPYGQNQWDFFKKWCPTSGTVSEKKNRMCRYTIVVAATVVTTIVTTVVTISVIPCRVATVVTTIVMTVVTISVIPCRYKSVVTIVGTIVAPNIVDSSSYCRHDSRDITCYSR